MKIFIGSDHAGYELKQSLVSVLEAQGYEVVDKGAFRYNDDDDYPDFIFPVAKEVSADPEAKGIVIGGSGQGEAISANRIPGVRAAVFYGFGEDPSGDITAEGLSIIRLSREHNDANVLSLGSRFLSPKAAETAVKTWFDTPFSGEERHARRIKKIDAGNIPAL